MKSKKITGARKLKEPAQLQIMTTGRATAMIAYDKIDITSHYLNILEAKELRNWLGRAIKYLEAKK